MAYTLSDTSQKALSLVLDEFDRMNNDTSCDAEQCEKLGRMLIAMFREQCHPARMFHLIGQVAEGFEISCEPVDVELLVPLAWAMAESSPKRGVSKSEAC